MQMQVIRNAVCTCAADVGVTADASKEIQSVIKNAQSSVDVATGAAQATQVGLQTGIQTGVQAGKRHLLGEAVTCTCTQPLHA